MASEIFANALRRYGGMWASAWSPEGDLLTDVVRVGASVQRGRIEMPLVGQEITGYKPGRRGQEGSLAFQKVDTTWELMVYNAMTLDVAELRRQRDAGNFANMTTFDLLLRHDDPHAFGKESWKLRGCQLWQLDVGIDTTEDFVQREIPLTFEELVPVETFKVVRGQVVKVNSVQG